MPPVDSTASSADRARRVRAFVIAASSLTVLVACANHASSGADATAGASSSGGPGAAPTSDPPAEGSGGSTSSGASSSPSCTITICLTGAISQTDDANKGLAALCDDPAIGPTVKDCDTGTCYSSFNTFPSNTVDGIYPRVFEALDTNHDGKVDLLDQNCAIRIVGFSWGGINAANLADALLSDAHVDSRVEIDHLVMLDAFQPLTESPIISPRVKHATTFRHSVAPPSDCSIIAPLGPYLGIPMRCAAGQSCKDYDYSKSPDVSFDVHGASPLLGKDIGHCNVPATAHAAVLALLKGAPYAQLPATVPIRP